MSYQAILFDMDGVVVDTSQSVTAFWQNLAARHQVQLTPADFSRDVYGCPATHTLDVLFPQLDAAERQIVLDDMVRYETTLAYTEVKGAVAFLRALKDLGFPTALVTSGEGWKVDAVTSQLGIDGAFSVRITASDIQRGKPHPECYLLATRRLGKSPERCIVFEDSISGVQAAVASGALCIGIRPLETAPVLLQAGARHVVQDFDRVRLLTHQADARTALSLHIDANHRLSLTISQDQKR
jgi:HAD superfamily hydrolase (TIGR01509 family)